MKKNIFYSCVLILTLMSPQAQAWSPFSYITNLCVKNIFKPVEDQLMKVSAVVGTGVIAGVAGTLATKMWLKKMFMPDGKPISWEKVLEELKKLPPETVKNFTFNDGKKLDNIINFTGTCGGVVCGIVGLWGMYKILYSDATASKEDLDTVEKNLTDKINNTATKTDLTNTEIKLKYDIKNSETAVKQDINKFEKNLKTDLNNTKIELTNKIANTATKVDNVDQNVKNVGTQVNKLGNQVNIVEKNLGNQVNNLGKQVDGVGLNVKNIGTQVNNLGNQINNVNNKLNEEVLKQSNFRTKTDKNFSDMDKKLEKVEKSTNSINDSVFDLTTVTNSVKNNILEVKDSLTTSKNPTSPEYQKYNYSSINNFVSQYNIKLPENLSFQSSYEIPKYPILQKKPSYGIQPNIPQKGTRYLTSSQRNSLTDN